MEEVFNRDIHRDDFRLRVLLTNGCNKRCVNCLNDFQPKGSSFIECTKLAPIISSYCNYMHSIKRVPQVEFSGGEPGLHPELINIARHAKKRGAFTKINTNGMAFFYRGIEKYIDCWHIGVTHLESWLLRMIKEVSGSIQFVVRTNNLKLAKDVVEFYSYYGIPIKLFVDFFATPEKQVLIENFISAIAERYNNITTRYTGVQENRGWICQECTKKCITLKALWVFTNSLVSPCPQGVISPEEFTKGVLHVAYKGHKFREKR